MNILKKIYTLLEDKPKRVLCLHFASDSLKIAFFGLDTAAAWTLLDFQVLHAKEPSKPASYADAIRAFLLRYQSGGRVGVIVTSKTDFVEKPVTLPEMPPAEIEAGVKFAMEHHFSIQLDSCLYSWMQSVEILPAHGMKANQYFVYAIPKKEAQAYLDFIAALPVTPLAITPSSVATAELLAPAAAVKDIGIVEMDMDSSTFQIYRKGKPLVSRGVNVGLRALGPAVKHSSSASQAGGEGVVDDAAADAMQAARPHIERLIAALQSSVDFYHQQNFSGELDRIYLVENGPSIPELDKLIQESIELPVARPKSNQLGSLPMPPPLADEMNGRVPEMLAAIGSFYVWMGRGLNLMPKDILFRIEAQARSKWLRFGALALAAACVFLTTYFFLTGGLTRKQLDVLRVEESSAMDLQGVNQKTGAIRTFKSQVMRGDLNFYALMKLLSSGTPDGCVITEIVFDKATKRFELQGKVLGGVPDAVGVSAQIVHSLSSSPFFAKAELLEGLRDAMTNEYRFRIAAVSNESV